MSREVKLSLIQKWASDYPEINISLWINCTKNDKGRIMNLKCKACTEFEKEISGMNGFRRTWIDGYTSGNQMD